MAVGPDFACDKLMDAERKHRGGKHYRTFARERPVAYITLTHENFTDHYNKYVDFRSCQLSSEFRIEMGSR